MNAVALQLLPAEGERPVCRQPSPGTFVQVLPGAVTAFCLEHDLGFDERALLEHLLDQADRATGVVEDCTLSGLARDLGLGPSGRRSLGIRLGRLVAIGALEWEPSYGSEAGRIEITVYSRLVRAGRGDRRAGYVQVLPGALAAACSRHSLSPNARALLRRLVVDVDHRTHALTGSLRQLTSRFGIGRRRLAAALDELAAAGLLRQLSDRVELRSYGEFVRTAPVAVASPAPRSDRAAAAPESRAPRVQNARPSSPLDVRDQDLEPEPTSTPQAASETDQGQVRSRSIDPPNATLAALALALPDATHHELLADPAQAPGRHALRRRLDELVARLGEADAVATLARDWPDHVDSAMALANNRAQRRLAEVATAAGTAAAVAELGAQQAARRRADALRGARNLGAAWAGTGATAEDVASQFAGDEQARGAALEAFHIALAGGETGTGQRRPDHLDKTSAHPADPPHRRRRSWSEGGPQRVAVSLAAMAGLSADGRSGPGSAQRTREEDDGRSMEIGGRLPEPDGHHVRRRPADRGALAM